MKRHDQRLLRIRRTIGVIGAHGPGLEPVAAQMLWNALSFAEDVSARYAVRRADEQTTMVFGRTALDLKLSLATPAVAKVAPEAHSQRKPEQPAVSPRMPLESPMHAPTGLEKQDSGGPKLQQTSIPLAMTATASKNKSVARADAPTPPVVESAQGPERMVSPRGGETSSPKPRHPQAPPFEPVPRRPRRIEQEIAMRVTKEIRHLQQISVPLAPASSATPLTQPAGPNETKPISVRHLTDDIVRELERRATARRERKGHV